ncbi:MAG: Motilin/ghrelin-associated peptide [Rhodobacteraceae bacterium HLUCCA12]|nr:MAG: Motilin/ghrelin-associated peptide [Rhodobacteraceae bacterium HLUCCA12]
MSHDQISSLTAELKTHFGVASMNREAGLKLTGEQWQRYRQLDEQFAKARKALNIAYSREYDTRVEMARRRLIDQAGSKNLNFKHRVFGRYAFDAGAITRQAQREVRFNHDAQVKALAIREHDAKESFLSQCVHQKEMRGAASRAFDTARNVPRERHPQRTR